MMSTVLKRLDAVESHVQLLSRMRALETSIPAPAASTTPPSTLGSNSRHKELVGRRTERHLVTRDKAYIDRNARANEPEDLSTDDILEGGDLDSANGDTIEARLAGKDLANHVMSLYKHMEESDPVAEVSFKKQLRERLSTPAIKAAARRLANDAGYLSDSS